MNRREEREWLVKISYESRARLEEGKKIEDFLINHDLHDASDYLIQSLRSLFIHVDAIDEFIESHLDHAKLDHLLRIDHAILRIAINELIYTKFAPLRVTINESVEIAKIYSDENSYKLINGILGTIAGEIDA